MRACPFVLPPGAHKYTRMIDKAWRRGHAENNTKLLSLGSEKRKSVFCFQGQFIFYFILFSPCSLRFLLFVTLLFHLHHTEK